ncbi:Uncharacterised protein [Vibrio cholerae]|uniref:Uncharacterized protein n=1 Tax=Vibrio cholerae TaxID=666 RepID=A0A655Y4L8_VIBCL|nr:Uncharacterised protein [Vibrio cholerae]CSC29284.1 Uncharacterised protein [Vibrio cholerae]
MKDQSEQLSSRLLRCVYEQFRQLGTDLLLQQQRQHRFRPISGQLGYVLQLHVQFCR